MMYQQSRSIVYLLSSKKVLKQQFVVSSSMMSWYFKYQTSLSLAQALSFCLRNLQAKSYVIIPFRCFSIQFSVHYIILHFYQCLRIHPRFPFGFLVQPFTFRSSKLNPLHPNILWLIQFLSILQTISACCPAHDHLSTLVYFVDTIS